MKKEKLFKIGVINESTIDVVKDMTTFYTSDTELWLGFELSEEGVEFDSAEILLFNIDDKSFVVRSVVKTDDKYWYELDMDMIAHHGQWKVQLQFTKNSEVYTSKHFNFRIENDLSNERPPKLIDITNWSNIKQTADSLIAEMKVAVTEAIEAESERQTTFEANESERDETFNTNEATRQVNENIRQQAEQARQSAELTRVENEKQRNLTSVDEFIKLQNAIGGRNYATENFSLYTNGLYYGYRKVAEIGESVTIKVIDRQPDVQLPTGVVFGLTENGGDGSGSVRWVDNRNTEITRNNLPYFSFYPKNEGTFRAIMDKYQIKVEKGTQTTPYTKPPEDYTVVSKDDYYNHIKMMSDHKDKQMAELKTAITALGGA